ncbi:MAG: tandem-95 repeat protein, partial [Betaproteobacteria bacterium]
PLLVDEQTDYLYPIAAIDEDPEDTVLSYALVLGPAGMQIDAAGGAVTWQPQAADLGIHAVTVRVSDAQGAFAEQAYLLTVADVNEAPQFVSVPPGSALVGDIYAYMAQASDPDAGDRLTYSIEDAPENVVLLPAQGLLLWRPGSTQTGAQSITLRVSDTAGLIDEQVFTVAVSAQNIAPVAEDDAYTVPANEPFVIAAPGVLANDGDANGDALTARLLELPLHGTLTFDPAGGFSYTPAAGFGGEDRFTYVVNDATADSAPATVVLDVQPVQIPIEVGLQIPDFMRGPGQPVDVPAALADGLPVTLVAADAVQQLRIAVHFDPTLLTITGAALVSGLPAGATLQIDLGTAGLAVIEIESPTPLPAGAIDLLRLYAEVPLDAEYSARHVFTVGAVTVNGVATDAEPAAVLHLVGYLGDVDGDETYTIADVTGIQEMVVGLIGAFDFWAGVNPLLVADVDANGFITSRDATRVNQELSGHDRAELPPIPDRSLLDLAQPVSGVVEVEASTLSGPPADPQGVEEQTASSTVEDAASGVQHVPVATSIEGSPPVQSLPQPGLLHRLFAALKAHLASAAGDRRDLYFEFHAVFSPIAATIIAHESVRTLVPGAGTPSIGGVQDAPQPQEPWVHRFVTDQGSAALAERSNQTLRVHVSLAQDVSAEASVPLSTG